MRVAIAVGLAVMCAVGGALWLMSRSREPAEDPSIYTIVYESSGWDTKVILNGIPVLVEEGGFGQQPVTNVVIHGTNSVSVEAVQQDGVIDPSPLRFGVERMSYSNPEEVSEWPIPLVEVAPADGGQVYRKSFEFECPTPMHWSWQDGEVLSEVSDSDREAIFRQVEELYEALRDKDLEAYRRTRRIGVEDWVRYTGENEEDLYGEEYALLGRLFSDDSYAVRLRDRAEMRVEVWGRVVLLDAGRRFDRWVIRIETSDEHRRFDFGHIALSKIHGEWHIIN